MTNETLETPHLKQFTADLIPNQGEGIARIIELAKSALEVRVGGYPISGLGYGLPNEVPCLLDPKSDQPIKSIAGLIESYRQFPARIKGVAKVETLNSFIGLVNRHKNENSVIFAQTDFPNPRLEAVIDYHGINHQPFHLQHRVQYNFPITKELKTWLNFDGKPIEQGAFAAFLEDHAAELTEPFEAEKKEFEPLFKSRFATPSEIIELSRALEVRVGQTIKRAENLSSGERVVEFNEEHSDKKGDKINIPGLFIIQLMAFDGGTSVRIVARLRYRPSKEGITWFYNLYRAEDMLRTRVVQDAGQAAGDTELPCYEGSPEA